jgi:hypothetical protein
MAPIATTISATSVHMRFANNPVPEEADQWLDFQVPLDNLLVVADSGQEQGLGNPNNQSLGAIRRAALGYVRIAIDAEIRRLLGGGD